MHTKDIMSKKVLKIGKRLFCIILSLVFSVNSFAALVSDNDSSALVTKAEFDALKQSFATQISDYNESIDDKIDGAIAYYLAGQKLSRKEIVKLDPTFRWSFPIICMNNSEWNNKDSKYYSYELPDYQTIDLTTRSGSTSLSAAGLAWNSTALPSAGSNQRSSDKSVCLNKTWIESNDIFSELIQLNDRSIERSLNGTNITCWNLNNVGKGRHKIEKFFHGGSRDAGHVTGNGKVTYWGYTGVIGIGYNGTRATRNQMTTGNFSYWTPGTWTRTNGSSHFACLGWGSQTARAFVLPTSGLNLDGARTWAQNYTNNDGTYCHEQGNFPGYADDTALTTSIKWKDGSNKMRNWVFTGDSDAPATSEYGWSFNFRKPNTSSEKFEGYIMKYSNDLAMANAHDGTWYGFHSWCPVWYWRYTASGSIGTAPSTSEFSKLQAKKIYYYDLDGKLHFMDEGLFLFNMPGVPESVTFDAKWAVLDPNVTTEQKIKLKISNTPFDSAHDDTKNLKYKVDGGTEAADQEIICGSVKKIEVRCDETVKQLYMMWMPMTTGTYIGLTDLSDFTVQLEQ